MQMQYHIAEEFTKTPGGRFKKHGPYSGEAFREDVLRELLRKARDSGGRLTIVPDGTAGYGSSFLEEAFGGLIRLGLFDRQQIKDHLELQALDPLYETYRLSANRYMDNTNRRHQGDVRPSLALPPDPSLGLMSDALRILLGFLLGLLAGLAIRLR